MLPVFHTNLSWVKLSALLIDSGRPKAIIKALSHGYRKSNESISGFYDSAKHQAKQQKSDLSEQQKPAQISTCWPARHQTGYKSDPNQHLYASKPCLAVINTHTTSTCSSVTYPTNYKQL